MSTEDKLKNQAQKVTGSIKEAAGNTCRITDLFNRLGDRYIIFSGLDDVALEGLLLGARGWVSGLTNAFLIRAPERVLASYTKKWSDVTLRDIGFVEQAEIFDIVAQHTGKAPPVVDTDDILADPRGKLFPYLAPSLVCHLCSVQELAANMC